MRYLQSAATVALLFVAQMGTASSLLLLNGHIYTANPRAPWAEAIAVSGSTIDAVGRSSSVRRKATHGATVIDLGGRTVIPGIIDGHAHTLYGSYALHGFNLSTPEASVTPDKRAELIAAVRRYAADHPGEKVLLGRADFSTTPPTTPGHELLDAAVSDRPVVVHNTSEHAVWLNAAALRFAGVTDQPVSDPVEEKGVIRDASGHPSGVLLEAAMQIAARAVDAQLTLDEKLALLRDGIHYLNSFGITTVINATGSLDEIKLYGQLRDRGELTLRTRTAFGDVAVPHRLTPAFLGQIEEARTQFHDRWVSANLIKFFADGSTGLVPPLVYEPHEYERMIIELDRRGFQIMTHAIRDDSVHMVLDAYQRLEAQNGPRDRRLRVEHLDLTRQEDLPRFAALSVSPVMQVSFCCGAEGMAFDPATAIATDRWKSLLDAGARLAFASDWPCTWPPSPFVALEQAVTRAAWRSQDTDGVAGQPLDGAAQGGARRLGSTYIPAERISVRQAIDAYTRESAYASFADGWSGTLEAGKEADLVVLSQDIFSVPAEQLSSTQVVKTLVGGKVVYERP